MAGAAANPAASSRAGRLSKVWGVCFDLMKRLGLFGAGIRQLDADG